MIARLGNKGFILRGVCRSACKSIIGYVFRCSGFGGKMEYIYIYTYIYIRLCLYVGNYAKRMGFVAVNYALVW